MLWAITFSDFSVYLALLNGVDPTPVVLMEKVQKSTYLVKQQANRNSWAVITGASGGIGRALAHECAQAGIMLCWQVACQTRFCATGPLKKTQRKAWFSVVTVQTHTLQRSCPA